MREHSSEHLTRHCETAPIAYTLHCCFGNPSHGSDPSATTAHYCTVFSQNSANRNNNRTNAWEKLSTPSSCNPFSLPDCVFRCIRGLCAPGCSAVLLLGLRSRLYGCIFTSNFFPPQQCSFFFFIHLIFDFSHLISCSCFTYISHFTCDQHFFRLQSSLGDCREPAIVTHKMITFFTRSVPFLFALDGENHTFSFFRQTFCKRGNCFDLTQSSVAPLGVGTSQKLVACCCRIASGVGWANSNLHVCFFSSRFCSKAFHWLPCPKTRMLQSLVPLQRKCKEQSDPNSAS